MIGIVLASHGDFAGALRDTAELIVGAQENVVVLCLNPQDTLETCVVELETAVQQSEQGQGVLVLIDLFGGTPGNAAALGLRERSYPIITGVNLPMLLEVLMNRDSVAHVDELAAQALQAGQQGIINMRERLQAQQASATSSPSSS